MKARMLIVLVAAGLAASALADDSGSRVKTQTVVAGQYPASGIHKWLFGTDYRDLWMKPVTLEVLDLQHEAGGLEAAFRVGGQQTKGLAMKGKDGRNYTFRGIYKYTGDLLSEDLQGTIVETLLNDQMAGQHPASDVIVRGLSDAAGVPCPGWRLVVMPDDPALGKFQKDYAGAIGAFAEYPSAVTKTNPGFLGITEIIDHLELYKRVEAGRGDAVDALALVKARLLDIVIGDWDRHRKQWRWAKFPGSPLWTPIPEDRDQAFSRYEGVALGLGRQVDPRFQNFGHTHPAIDGLTRNGREQDRRLLVGLTREQFKETAEALQARLTDAAIESAVGLMPAEWKELDGARLARDIKVRRDALPHLADRYYLHLADWVDVYLTKRPDSILAERQPNGDLSVTTRIAGAEGAEAAPYYHRVFHRGETDEVRLYTLGGDDQVVVTGGASGIGLRVIGGPGHNTLDDAQGGGTRLSDSEGTDVVSKGPGTSVDRRTYTPPPPPKDAPWIPPRDFGSDSLMMPWISYGADIGAFVGWGIALQDYRFRKDPYANRQVLRAGYAFGEGSFRADYTGTFHLENQKAFLGLHAYGSGVEVLRFYGIGNDTPKAPDTDFNKAHENQFLFNPTFDLPLSKAMLSFGPVVRYSSSDRGEDTLVNTTRPYGFGNFGQAGVHAALTYDGRDSEAFPRKGILLAARGTVWPKVWSVTETFGEVDANANGYLSAGKWLTLAARVGGKKVYGNYPFLDAAYIGGGGLLSGALDEPGITVRGFRARRFGGDASLYGNSDLRLRLGQITLVVPAHVGVFGLADVGRVFVNGSNADTWHTSVGGGIWLSFLNYRNTFSVYVAHSREDNVVHAGGGFTF